MKIGIVGDLHFKDSLSFSFSVKDHREKEKQDVLQTIISSLADCDSVVFMGDQLDTKQSSPHVIKDFITFIEAFHDKQLFFLAGNHEKWGDGRSAIDFLREVKNKQWHVISNSILRTFIDGKRFVFLPYFTPSELERRWGGQDKQENVERILAELHGEFLFAHHAISGVETYEGQTDLFKEIVLPMEKLLEKIPIVFAGHIHKPGVYTFGSKFCCMTGSIFTKNVGEDEKFVWKLDIDSKQLERVQLPVRPIKRISSEHLSASELEEMLESCPSDSILRIINTNPELSFENILKKTKQFDGVSIKNEFVKIRKQIQIDEDEFHQKDIPGLLRIFAKIRNLPEEDVLQGFDLIPNTV